ncbi:MAG: T9SS type A sorting domain-containing protein [Candidatus Latescibacterota bacterium]|nr:MAG: T9SS type A sorting domain-containing protein [Candidatus Latescibacterota bacterium]
MCRRIVDPLTIVLSVIVFFICTVFTPGDAVSQDDELVNEPPTAVAGGDQTVECTGTFLTGFKTLVMLDGTGSFDPEGDPLTYLWTAPGVVFDDPNSPTPTGQFSLGTTTVTLYVSDGLLDHQDTVDITVEDTTPPLISVSLNRDILWPPNHEMADIFAVVTVNIECCWGAPSVVLTSITSNEPDNGQGDGNTIMDIQAASFGFNDNQFKLRSERSGGGDGRVYTIVYTATDCAGNEASDTAYVRVPHSQSEGRAFASVGFTPDGADLDRRADQFVLIVPSKPAKEWENNRGKPKPGSVGFDATALDLEKTYVGNVKAVFVPERSMEVDANDDGLMDLALFYATRDVQLLIREMMLKDSETVATNRYGPIGLHYRSPEGVDYLVPNIFELGKPVPLEDAGDSESAADTGDPDPLGESDGAAPGVTALLPNYPNPFNPSTTIPFNLVKREQVTLRIYNAQGMLVRTLQDDIFPAGLHRVLWDGRDNNGHNVATGVYFVRLVAGSFETTRKMVLLR